MKRYLNIFLFEFKHFKKSKTKNYKLFVFLLLPVYFSINNGFELQEKQLDTIENIQNKEESLFLN